MGLQLAEGVSWIPVDDGLVIFCAAIDSFVDLDESATELWTVMHGAGWAAEAAVEYLVVTYAMDGVEARRIVTEFLEALGSNGVLSPGPD